MAAQTRTGSQRYQKFATTTKRPMGCTRYSQRYFRSAVALSTCYFSPHFSLRGLLHRRHIFSNLFCNRSLSTRGESIFLSLSFSTNHFPSFRSNYHSRFPRNIPPFGTRLKIPLFSLLLFFLTRHFCRSSSSPWFKGNFSTILFIGVVLLHNA